MYSILMTVHPKEKPCNLSVALDSIINQSLISDDIVVVKDGVFSKKLSAVINDFSDRIGDIVTVIDLDFTHGVAEASNIGLFRCKNELIARMDSDDISLPDRFEVQHSYMNKHKDVDLVGGFINEFSDENDTKFILKPVPLGDEEICATLQKRNSINHVSVMFRKSSVLDVGAYIQIDGHVDYFLWVRMALGNKKMVNLDTVFVNVRAGEWQIRRRGGIKYILSEFKFQWTLVNLGFLPILRAIINIIIRLPFRLAPARLRVLMYNILLR